MGFEPTVRAPVPTVPRPVILGFIIQWICDVFWFLLDPKPRWKVGAIPLFKRLNGFWPRREAKPSTVPSFIQPYKEPYSKYHIHNTCPFAVWQLFNWEVAQGFKLCFCHDPKNHGLRALSSGRLAAGPMISQKCWWHR